MCEKTCERLNQHSHIIYDICKLFVSFFFIKKMKQKYPLKELYFDMNMNVSERVIVRFIKTKKGYVNLKEDVSLYTVLKISLSFIVITSIPKLKLYT